MITWNALATTCHSVTLYWTIYNGACVYFIISFVFVFFLSFFFFFSLIVILFFTVLMLLCSYYLHCMTASSDKLLWGSSLLGTAAVSLSIFPTPLFISESFIEFSWVHSRSTTDCMTWPDSFSACTLSIEHITSYHIQCHCLNTLTTTCTKSNMSNMTQI